MRGGEQAARVPCVPAFALQIHYLFWGMAGAGLVYALYCRGPRGKMAGATRGVVYVVPPPPPISLPPRTCRLSPLLGRV